MWHENGRPDILWSVNKLARSVTKINGQDLVTDGQQDWFHTFITQLTIDSIVVSIVNWIYSKTQTLLATLRTQNPPRWSEGSYVSSEVEAGCALNKRQYPAVLQNRKLFRWMLDREWLNHLFLMYGTW